MSRPGEESNDRSYGSQLRDVLEQAAHLQPVQVGATPREAVYREDQMTLYRYGEAPSGPPVLVVYSLINRPYILDLRPGRSLIQFLHDCGYTVYLIDWGDPEPVDQFLTLDDYINGYIHRCVDVIIREHGVTAVNILGVCQGGTMTLCYAALHPSRVDNIVNLVTPVDFHAGDGILFHLSRYMDFDAAVDAQGIISADLLNAIYVSLKPYRLLSQRYVEMPALAGDEQALTDFLRMERWMYDSPNQAGEAYRQFAKEFYQGNQLPKGTIKLGGQTVRLDRISMPVLNVYASADHLIPRASVSALREHISSADYQEHEFPGGHLGVFVSRRAQQELFPAIAEWLFTRT